MNCNLLKQTLHLSPQPLTLTDAWSAIPMPQIALAPSLLVTQLQDICHMSFQMVYALLGFFIIGPMGLHSTSNLA
jgi:hypothetical protein